MLMLSFFNLEHSWFRQQHLRPASSMHELGSVICQMRCLLALLLRHVGLDDGRTKQSFQSWGVRGQVGHQVLPLTVHAQGARGSPQQRLTSAGLLQFD